MSQKCRISDGLLCGAVLMVLLAGCSVKAHKVRSEYVDTPQGPAFVFEADGRVRVGSPIADKYLGGDDGEFNIVDIELGKE